MQHLPQIKERKYFQAIHNICSTNAKKEEKAFSAIPKN
jgi:hypothetical protein